MKQHRWWHFIAYGTELVAIERDEFGYWEVKLCGRCGYFSEYVQVRSDAQIKYLTRTASVKGDTPDGHK